MNTSRTISLIAACGFISLGLGSSVAVASVLPTSYDALNLGKVTSVGTKVSGAIAGMNASAQVIGVINDQAFYSNANGIGQNFLTMPTGAYDVAVTGINDQGQILGSYSYSPSNSSLRQVFVTGAQGQGLTLLNTPSALPTDAKTPVAINNQGQVLVNSGLEAYVYSPNGSSWQQLAHPYTGPINFNAFNNTSGSALGAQGQAAGTTYTSASTSSGFISGPNGVGATYLPKLTVTDINANGNFVGYGNTSTAASGYTQAFYANASGSNVKGLGTLKGTATSSSTAFAVNDLGQVVGYSDVSNSLSSGYHAFVTDENGGRMVDLNSLVSNLPAYGDLTQALSINNAGQILAYSQTGIFYLLTPSNLPVIPGQPPIPEASTFTMLALGLGALGWMTRRKNLAAKPA